MDLSVIKILLNGPRSTYSAYKRSHTEQVALPAIQRLILATDTHWDLVFLEQSTITY